MNLIWAKQLPVEPGASVCPMTVGRCGGNAERFGCVAEVDSGEVAKLNELRRERIKRIETFECFVESEKLVWGDRANHIEGFQVDALPTSPSILRRFRASTLDQDPSHRLGRRLEKVAAAGPVLGPGYIDKADIGFVNQGRGLERLPWPLPSHLCRRDRSQFFIDKR